MREKSLVSKRQFLNRFSFSTHLWAQVQVSDYHRFLVIEERAVFTGVCKVIRICFDLPQNLGHLVFQSDVKPKPIVTLTCFPTCCVWSKILALSFHWFTALSEPFVITSDQSDFFGFGFCETRLKTTLSIQRFTLYD